MALDTLEAIRTRRVARYCDQTRAVPGHMLRDIVEVPWEPDPASNS